MVQPLPQPHSIPCNSQRGFLCHTLWSYVQLTLFSSKYTRHSILDKKVQLADLWRRLYYFGSLSLPFSSIASCFFSWCILYSASVTTLISFATQKESSSCHWNTVKMGNRKWLNTILLALVFAVQLVELLLRLLVSFKL